MIGERASGLRFENVTQSFNHLNAGGAPGLGTGSSGDRVEAIVSVRHYAPDPLLRKRPADPYGLL